MLNDFHNYMHLAIDADEDDTPTEQVRKLLTTVMTLTEAIEDMTVQSQAVSKTVAAYEKYEVDHAGQIDALNTRINNQRDIIENYIADVDRLKAVVVAMAIREIQNEENNQWT